MLVEVPFEVGDIEKRTTISVRTDKKISDTSFANGIQYLISAGIIKIS